MGQTLIKTPILPELFYKTLMDSMFDAVYTVDNKGVITYWNASCARITGYSADEMTGQNYHDSTFAFVDENDRSSAKQPDGIQIVLDTAMPGTWKGRIRRRNGQRLPIESHISPLCDQDGQVIGAVAVFRDVSAQVALEEAHVELLKMSRHDQLTGLFNRNAIGELLQAEIERSRRYHQDFSVVMMDLDHFKAVNDRFGHDAGDKVLNKVGRLLLDNLRDPDAPGRWGGEEFLILAPGSQAVAARNLAERIRRFVKEISLPEVPIALSASFGVSQLNADQSRDQLLYVADRALYQAKDASRDRTVIGRS